MIVNKLKFSDFLKVLGQSIECGKKHYIVFFVGALIWTLIFEVLKLVPVIGVLSSLFLIFCYAGYIYVSQKTIERRQAPSITDFFIVFSNVAILKRLVSFLILTIVLATLVLGLFGGFGYLAIRNAGDISSYLTPVNLALFAIASILAFVIIMLPMMFFDKLLLLRPLTWRECLKMSAQGVKRNFILIFVILLVYFSTFGLLSAFLTRGFAIDGKILSTILQLVASTISPFFLAVMYLLYKNIYTFDSPDLVLDGSTTYENLSSAT